MTDRLARRCAIKAFVLVVAFVGLVGAGCGGAPVAPSKPEARQPEAPLPEDRQQAWNPFVVVQPGGRIFVTYYGGPGGAEYRLLFTRSLDNGVTWLPEPVQLDAQPPQRTRIGFHRLEASADGRVSVTWSIERKEETFWRLREVRHRQSPDLGASWKGETLRWPFNRQGNYATPRTGQDGELYLLWAEGVSSRNTPRFIGTTGGGVAWWAAPKTLPGNDTSGRWQGKERFREVNWPFLATGPGGGLYAAWQEATEHGTDIVFNRSKDSGRTWLESSPRLNAPPASGGYTTQRPMIALDKAGGIYVTWEDFRHNTIDLYFNRSLDGGATWLNQDLWLTAVRPQQSAATDPVLSADRSGNLYLLWQDSREAPNSIYFSRSLDRGATWLLQPIKLDHHSPKAITGAHRLAHDDAGHVYVAWWEGTETTGSVKFRRSDDFGATWSENEHILDSGLGKEGPWFPWLSADGQGGVCVVWRSDRSGRYQLYLNRSMDHGKTWLPADVQITGSSVRHARGS